MRPTYDNLPPITPEARRRLREAFRPKPLPVATRDPDTAVDVPAAEDTEEVTVTCRFR